MLRDNIRQRKYQNLYSSRIRYKKILTDSDLFREGDTFTLDDYGSQFPQKEIKHLTENVLDSGTALGWEFTIEKLTSEYAIVNLVRI